MPAGGELTRPDLQIGQTASEQSTDDYLEASATRSVNMAMVYGYFEVGRIIVEEEQAGSKRAGYGKRVIAKVSQRLTAEFGRGYSMTNVEQMRKFYRVYGRDSIPQKVSEEFGGDLPLASTGRKFLLSWSHYLKLMRMDDEGERHFYEIECARNGWSLAELRRQFDSGLYQRLALSRDKEGVMALAKEGQVIEKPADAIKDPFVSKYHTVLPSKDELMGLLNEVDGGEWSA